MRLDHRTDELLARKFELYLCICYFSSEGAFDAIEMEATGTYESESVSRFPQLHV